MKILLFFFLFINCFSFAQNKSSNIFITGINVIDDNQLKIDWQLQNASTYDSIIIFQSLNYNSGYKRLIAFSDINVTSYTFTNNTFLYTDNYFFVAAKAGNTIIYSDTVRPIVLNIQPTILLNYAGYEKHKIVISWKHPFVSSTVPGSFVVYRKINNQNYSVLATLDHTTTQYQYEYFNCVTDSISQYVSFQPDLPRIHCNSNLKNCNLAALNKAKIPRFDSVSFINDNTVQIVWLKGHELTQQYILYLNQTAGNIVNPPLTGPLSINDTVFTYQPTVTDTGSLIYLLTLTDVCNNTIGTYTNNSKRSTVFLHKPTIDICNKKIFLKWNAPLMPDVDSFFVYVSVWNGPWQKLTAVSSKTLQYTYSMLPYNAEYKFMIRAKSSLRKKTSSSNRQIINMIYPPTAADAFCYIPSYADDKLLFKWVVEPIAKTSFYLEESCNNNPFSKIANFSISDNNIYNFDIPKDIYNKDSCKYVMHFFDSCGNKLFSKTFAPIRLEIEEWDTYVNCLTWKIPQLSKMQLQKVTLHRMSKTNDPSIDKQFELPTTFTGRFVDSVSPYYKHKGDFEYQLQINYLDSIRWNAEIALSNKVISKIHKEIFVPNAFTPGAATNNIFKPILIFVPENNYYFVIFNRNGQKVFETHNPAEGWDGIDKFAGGLAPQGTYVYIIQYRNKTGKIVDKTGSITLLR